jgi:hypothetical protein
MPTACAHEVVEDVLDRFPVHREIVHKLFDFLTFLSCAKFKS